MKSFVGSVTIQPRIMHQTCCVTIMENGFDAPGASKRRDRLISNVRNGIAEWLPLCRSWIPTFRTTTSTILRMVRSGVICSTWEKVEDPQEMLCDLGSTKSGILMLLKLWSKCYPLTSQYKLFLTLGEVKGRTHVSAEVHQIFRSSLIWCHNASTNSHPKCLWLFRPPWTSSCGLRYLSFMRSLHRSSQCRTHYNAPTSPQTQVAMISRTVVQSLRMDLPITMLVGLWKTGTDVLQL